MKNRSVPFSAVGPESTGDGQKVSDAFGDVQEEGFHQVLALESPAFRWGRTSTAVRRPWLFPGRTARADARCLGATYSRILSE